MTTALYRRYRPETFGEMIGQEQVTEPLMTALRSDRIGHAYLFSGPRGCGKTTSARILARCLNCAEGPTDTPCGVCPSCVELGRGGGGSLDVVEIDAASHNGVDDARDLRERAIFAPARDRFKIFILDEAHMVTPQGFNALLKLVEEPPDHVKFIFATTEPEKVIGTIRSRTHHYPFRLVPPATMLGYIEQVCAGEDVVVDAGVLPLVVRSGGGSPRDTLSVLDQLIAGADGGRVAYDRAVSLLGYTPAELLDEVVDALAREDAAAAFDAVERVLQTGQDPRRFVDDLLERLRDLIVLAAAGEGAATVLTGVAEDERARMARQAAAVGADRLSRTADIVMAALDEMTGATSPRLQLELMVARVLVRAASSPEAERAVAVPAPAAAPVAAAPVAAPSAASGPPEPVDASSEPVAGRPEPIAVPPSTRAPAEPLTRERVRAAWPEILARLERSRRSTWLLVTGADAVDVDGDVLTLAFASRGEVDAFKKRSAGRGPSEDLRAAIEDVLGARVKFIARHDAREDGPAVPGADGPQQTASTAPSAAATPAVPGGGRREPVAGPVTDWPVTAIAADPDVADGDPSGRVSAPSDVARPLPVDDEPEDARAGAPARTAVLAPDRDGEIVIEPVADQEDEAAGEVIDVADVGTAAAGAGDAPRPPAPLAPVAGRERYGEAVVRQVLGARFIGEEPYAPPPAGR